MKLQNMNEVIDRKRYKTETSILLASDAYWDGRNYERHGRNTFLMCTKNGNYFLQHQTCYQGERNTIEPIGKEQAMSEFERLPEKEVEFEEAFPGEIVEDA